jgi:hypothetical protein
MGWGKMQQKGAMRRESYCTIRGYDNCEAVLFLARMMVDVEAQAPCISNKTNF